MSQNLIDTAKSAGALVGGAGLAQLFNFVGTIFTAYFFEPFEFGVYMVFVSTHALIASFATLRFELALVVEEEKETVYDLYCISTMALSFICLIVFFSVQFIKIENFSEVGRGGAFFLLPLSIFFAGQYALAGQWCARNGNFKRMALGATIIPVVTIMVQGGGYFFSPTSGSLIFGYLCGQVAGVAMLWWRLAETVNLKRLFQRLFGWSQLAKAARKHYRFAVYQMPNSLASAAYTNLPSVMLGTLASPEAAGAFSLAFKAVFQPLSLLPAAFGQVVFAKMSRTMDRLNDWEVPLANAYVFLGLAFVFPCAVVMCFGREVAVLVLGDKWALAGTLAQVLVLPCVMMALAAGYDRLYDVVGAQRKAFLLSIGSALIVVSSAYIVISYTKEARGYAFIFSVIHIIYSYIWTIFAIKACHFSVKKGTERWISVVVFSTILMLFMYLIFWITGFLFASILSGFVIYAVSLWIYYRMGGFPRYGQPSEQAS